MFPLGFRVRITIVSGVFLWQCLKRPWGLRACLESFHDLNPDSWSWLLRTSMVALLVAESLGAWALISAVTRTRYPLFVAASWLVLSWVGFVTVAYIRLLELSRNMGPY